MPKSKADPNETIPFSWWIEEKRYWVMRAITNRARAALYAIMPRWLVRETFMYAQRYIKDDEIVPDVLFMTVFERICKNDGAGGMRVRGTRVTK